MKTIIVDLDGTLALIDHRRHLVEGKKKNRNLFFERCVDDAPNKPVIKLIKILFVDYSIAVLSGRSETVRDDTVQWLSYHNISFNKLYMRPEGDYTPDEILINKWADEDESLSPENVFCVFDDRNKVVKMWRDNGYTCLQVADGNF